MKVYFLYNTKHKVVLGVFRHKDTAENCLAHGLHIGAKLATDAEVVEQELLLGQHMWSDMMEKQQ